MNNTSSGNASNEPPIIEPDTDASYTIEVVVELTGVSSQTILLYEEQGLISPVTDSGSGARYFNDEALRTLRRIEHLRSNCEVNVPGLKLMLSLMDEVERLRAELRSRRGYR